MLILIRQLNTSAAPPQRLGWRLGKLATVFRGKAPEVRKTPAQGDIRDDARAAPLTKVVTGTLETKLTQEIHWRRASRLAETVSQRPYAAADCSADLFEGQRIRHMVADVVFGPPDVTGCKTGLPLALLGAVEMLVLQQQMQQHSLFQVMNDRIDRGKRRQPGIAEQHLQEPEPATLDDTVIGAEG